MKHTTRKEIKLSRKIVTSNNEVVEVFDDHFSNVCPTLAVFDNSLLSKRVVIFLLGHQV